MTGLSVGSTSVDLGSGSETYAAIDTGTTLVGGPSAQIAALFAGIEGSQAGTGNYEGYYLYRAFSRSLALICMRFNSNEKCLADVDVGCWGVQLARRR